MKYYSRYIAKGYIKLGSYDTINLDYDKATARKHLKKERKDLADFQEKLYAHGKYSFLVCFQGMDTSGKDSLIREVFKSFNVRGVEQHSFKQPTSKELSHNYLWRHYLALPARGHFGIFNRSHYENVLVTRVHPDYLLLENLPSIEKVADVDEAFWFRRYNQINNFESGLFENGTKVVKFYLHLSKEEQKRRLLRRLEIPSKNWKFSASDLKERELWDKYQYCYEQLLNKTSNQHNPWFIVPADDKANCWLIVLRILNEISKQFKDVTYPELDSKLQASLENFKVQLNN